MYNGINFQGSHNLPLFAGYNIISIKNVKITLPNIAECVSRFRQCMSRQEQRYSKLCLHEAISFWNSKN